MKVRGQTTSSWLLRLWQVVEERHQVLLGEVGQVVALMDCQMSPLWSCDERKICIHSAKSFYKPSQWHDLCVTLTDDVDQWCASLANRSGARYRLPIGDGERDVEEVIRQVLDVFDLTVGPTVEERASFELWALPRCANH